MILRLALRNVARHRRRTILTVLAVVVCFALLLIANGLSDGAHDQMVDIAVRMGLGHVIVYGEGYLDDPSNDKVVADPATVIKAAQALGPRVTTIVPRLRMESLIQAGSASVGVTLLGVDPAIEEKASKIASPKSIVEGAALPTTPPEPGTLPPVVVGRALAKTLGVQLGDRVTLTVRPVGGGAMKTGAFEVHGIFSTGVHDIDGFWAEAPLPAVQKLAAAGDAVTMVALLLKSANDTDAVRADLDRAIQAKEHHLDVAPWQKAAPELNATIVLDQGGMYLTLLIVFVVVAAGILNTILMSVLERTREFGVLLALGAKPGRVIALVLTEALLIGIVSIVFGLALGVASNHYLATVGLDVKAGLGANVEASGVLLPERIYSALSPVTLVWSTIAVAVLVVAGAIYPAMLAARLEPVEAIRHA